MQIVSMYKLADETVETIARRLLEMLDDEVGPAALRVLAEWSVRPGGTPLRPADLERAAGVVNEMTGLTRGAARHLAGFEPAAQHVADAELLATQWLERVTGPDRPCARPAGRLGLLMLGEGQRILKAAVAALDGVAASEDGGGRHKPRRGRPARRPRVVKRMLELTRGAEPDESALARINDEFGYDYDLDTLRRYYRDRDAHLQKLTA